MKLGQFFGYLAGIVSLIYLLLGLATSEIGRLNIIYITGLFAIALWILVIIDIDALLKERAKKVLEEKDKLR